MTPPPYGQPAPAANDKTTLWGVLGIVFAFCCTPLAIVFAILSLLEARKVGKQPTLAFVSFGIIAVLLIVQIIFYSTGGYDSITGN
ncbi:DUF4190 domain-containing protein [Amorphoplanes digitatis]|uniref:DUF4190 domain-containing protein n=1 Tax=Actinoplanes digitatis TaxID=1868 RepID=A0A7W7I522_9ACTN|nr:DUF4190 domain-containing protein [Actinoplanes digitatis]MBB4766439.1 hypothetical protein [Actinoplanes digitatis]BFE76522.1 hypothetical protein GCM10020092_098230 [Actinoplanes digitatis]GID96730.1 hypothetical protein Adi01nite_61420 [Actinoplanes digitatis]